MRKFVPIADRKPLEKTIERKHAKKAKEAGYFVTKIVSTSTDGFPDHFYARAGRITLIEWKREGEQPEPLQVERIKELRAVGVEVYVVDSVKAANKILGIK